jgi:hypothetical protein
MEMSEVLAAVFMESSFFWNITRCGPLKVNRRIEGDMFLRKVGWLSTNYVALYSRRQKFSDLLLFGYHTLPLF